MSEHIESIFLAAFFFPAAAAVLIFLMKYVSSVLQARVRLGQDEAYRELATSATAGQAQTLTAISALGANIEGVQARLANIERILKNVE